MSELNEKLATAWEGFTKGDWQNEVCLVFTYQLIQPGNVTFFNHP